VASAWIGFPSQSNAHTTHLPNHTTPLQMTAAYLCKPTQVNPTQESEIPWPVGSKGDGA